MRLKSPHHVRCRVSMGLCGIELISASQRSACTIGAKNIPILLKLACLIGIDVGWSPGISAWDCHLIHGNDIGPLSTAATKYLHCFAKEFCQKIVGRIFQGASFPCTLCTVDEFSLGPVFLMPSGRAQNEGKMPARLA